MLPGNFLTMHYSMGMVALDLDDLWNGQLNRILNPEHGRVLGYSRKERNVYSLWNHRISSNFFVLDF